MITYRYTGILLTKHANLVREKQGISDDKGAPGGTLVNDTPGGTLAFCVRKLPKVVPPEIVCAITHTATATVGYY